MSARLPSIRSRLARALVGWSILWSVVVSAAVWFAVQQEVDELLDDTLQAAAAVLRGPLSAEQQTLPSSPVEAASAAQQAPVETSGRFIWQVVDYLADGKAPVLASSPLAPRTALRAVPTSGFGDASDYRIFGTALPDGRRWLYVGQSHSERLEAQLEVAISAAVATLAIALLAHLWLRRRLRRELMPLRRLAERLAAYQPEGQVATLGRAERAELQAVHAAIDDLTARLAKKLVQERAFAAHAAHALRTPLAGIDAQLAVALQESPPQMQPRLQRVRSAAARLQRVVAALLALFRSGGQLHRVPIDLVSFVARLPIEGVIVEVADAPPLLADADVLAAALLNLFDNSLRNGAAHIRVSLSSPGTLRVDDDGRGQDSERRQGLRAALAAQEYDGNMGLGLMLADLVARAHGGALRLPDSERGFAVELRLEGKRIGAHTLDGS